MARKSKNPIQEFVTELATNADMLLEFIKNPDRVMKNYKKHKISEKDRLKIRNLLALEISKKLILCPDGTHVHW